MWKGCLLGLLLLFPGSLHGAAATPPPSSEGGKTRAIDSAFTDLRESYPSHRRIEGGVSMLSGAITGFGGFFLFLDTKRPDDEGLVGLAASGLGAVIGIDGLIRFFGRSSAELVYPHEHGFPSGRSREYGDRTREQYGEETLQRLASNAKQARLIRGALDLLASGAHWFLFARGKRTVDASGVERGKDIYPYLIGPAVLLSATALYRLFFHSPEERAWNRYREGVPQLTDTAPVRFELGAIPTPEGGWLSARLSF